MLWLGSGAWNCSVAAMNRNTLHACWACVLLFTTSLALGAPGETIPKELRGGSFECDQATVALALELTAAGWVYVMPEPKSGQADWGNSDRRTTWWMGYWRNAAKNETSAAPPEKVEGQFVGDGKGRREWNRGGTPDRPDKLEWLCSKDGGIEPE
jgi:hypothetical protein